MRLLFAGRIHLVRVVRWPGRERSKCPLPVLWEALTEMREILTCVHVLPTTPRQVTPMLHAKGPVHTVATGVSGSRPLRAAVAAAP